MGDRTELKRRVRQAREALDAVEAAVDEGAPDVGIRQSAAELFLQRRARDEVIPPGFFNDPLWDMLLVLYSERESGRDGRQRFLFGKSAVPHTTGLRHVRTLRDAGFVAVRQEPKHPSRTIIVLTDEGAERMQRFFEAI